MGQLLLSPSPRVLPGGSARTAPSPYVSIWPRGLAVLVRGFPLLSVLVLFFLFLSTLVVFSDLPYSFPTRFHVLTFYKIKTICPYADCWVHWEDAVLRPVLPVWSLVLCSGRVFLSVTYSKALIAEWCWGGFVCCCYRTAVTHPLFVSLGHFPNFPGCFRL